MAPALPKPVESAALSAQTEAEARRDMEASTGFSGRVPDWWQEYRKDTLSQQAEGAMRLTASGEDGRQRPCCAFVRPLQLGRSAVLIDHVMLTLPASVCVHMAYQGHCTSTAALQQILGSSYSLTAWAEAKVQGLQLQHSCNMLFSAVYPLCLHPCVCSVCYMLM